MFKAISFSANKIPLYHRRVVKEQSDQGSDESLQCCADGMESPSTARTSTGSCRKFSGNVGGTLILTVLGFCLEAIQSREGRDHRLFILFDLYSHAFHLNFYLPTCSWNIRYVLKS
jgi:hypothetical protein